LTPRARSKVAQLVVDQEVPASEVAARFQYSWPTVKRWAVCYRAGESDAWPVFAAAPQPEQDPGFGWSNAVCDCGCEKGWTGLLPTWESPPPRSARSWLPVGWIGSRSVAGAPVNRSAVTSTTTLAYWSTLRWRTSAVSLTVEGGVSLV